MVKSNFTLLMLKLPVWCCSCHTGQQECIALTDIVGGLTESKVTTEDHTKDYKSNQSAGLCGSILWTASHSLAVNCCGSRADVGGLAVLNISESVVNRS